MSESHYGMVCVKPSSRNKALPLWTTLPLRMLGEVTWLKVTQLEWQSQGSEARFIWHQNACFLLHLTGALIDQPSPLARHPISGPPTSPDRLCPARVGSDGHTPTQEHTCSPLQGSSSVMWKPTYAGLLRKREGAVLHRNGLFHLAGGR